MAFPPGEAEASKIPFQSKREQRGKNKGEKRGSLPIVRRSELMFTSSAGFESIDTIVQFTFVEGMSSGL